MSGIISKVILKLHKVTIILKYPSEAARTRSIRSITLPGESEPYFWSSTYLIHQRWLMFQGPLCWWDTLHPPLAHHLTFHQKFMIVAFQKKIFRKIYMLPLRQDMWGYERIQSSPLWLGLFYKMHYWITYYCTTQHCTTQHCTTQHCNTVVYYNPLWTLVKCQPVNQERLYLGLVY